MDQYEGAEVYPPKSWVDQCRALVPNEQVWVLLAGWSWLEAWDTGVAPALAVRCALLDVLAPEVGANYVIDPRA
jgi:hypothetical protein